MQFFVCLQDDIVSMARYSVPNFHCCTPYSLQSSPHFTIVYSALSDNITADWRKFSGDSLGSSLCPLPPSPPGPYCGGCGAGSNAEES